MPQYLVANYLPDDFDPSTVTEEFWNPKARSKPAGWW
jgi:hypothetical protein